MGIQSPVAKFIQGIQARLLETLDGSRGRPAAAGGRHAHGRGHRAGAPARGPGAPVQPDPGPIATSSLGSSIFPSWSGTPTRSAWDAVHHPFTAPRDEDLPLLESDPGARPRQGLRSRAERPGSGGRLHPHPSARGAGARLRPDRHLQGGRPGALRLPARRARVRRAAHGRASPSAWTGWPPTWRAQESIREVIAFPKTQKGTCPLTDAPAPVDPEQLRELGIRLVEGLGSP